MLSIFKIFLRAKHWQLFILLFGLPLLPFLILFLVVFKDLFIPSARLNLYFDPIELFQFFFSLWSLVYLGWFRSVGYLLIQISPDSLVPNKKFFRFSINYSVVYFLVYIFLLEPFLFASRLSSVAMSFIFPIHFLSVIIMFYNLIFISRTLAILEKGRKVLSSEYAKFSFLIWFLPIGIWSIQPRINRLYRERYNS